MHPLSAAWLVLALLAVAGSRLRDPRAWAWAAGALAVALGLCLLWPYFPVLELAGDSGDLEALNQSMYSSVVSRVFPALLGLVVIARRSRADRLDLLGLFLLGSAGLWVVGAVTDNTSFGRSLAFVVIVLDIALADGVARIEAHTRWRDAPAPVRVGAGVVAGLLLLGLLTTRAGWVRMVPESLLPGSMRDADELVRPDEQYDFLIGSVGRTEVVIGARAADNRIIPALAGRTLALGVPRPFVTDAAERRQAQREYLDPATDPARRREIQEGFDVRFVLLHATDRRDRSLLAVLLRDGAAVVHEDDRFLLVELDP